MRAAVVAVLIGGPLAAADWSEIMRPEAPAPIPKAAVREPDETHPPAGKLIYRGGWWYEADGRGGDTFCESCNGMTEAAALAWWHADQARRKATTRAPGVPAAPVFHAGHDCPRCRRPEYVQERQLPDGTHTHRCANCAAVWRH
jgi:hypothetical protein